MQLRTTTTDHHHTVQVVRVQVQYLRQWHNIIHIWQPQKNIMHGSSRPDRDITGTKQLLIITGAHSQKWKV